MHWRQTLAMTFLITGNRHWQWLFLSLATDTGNDFSCHWQQTLAMTFLVTGNRHRQWLFSHHWQQTLAMTFLITGNRHWQWLFSSLATDTGNDFSRASQPWQILKWIHWPCASCWHLTCGKMLTVHRNTLFSRLTCGRFWRVWVWIHQPWVERWRLPLRNFPACKGPGKKGGKRQMQSRLYTHTDQSCNLDCIN